MMKKKKLLFFKILSMSLIVSSLCSWMVYQNIKINIENDAQKQQQQEIKAQAEIVSLKNKNIESQVKVLAKNSTTIEALNQFSISYSSFANEMKQKVNFDKTVEKLKKVYDEEYNLELKKANTAQMTFDYSNLTKDFSETTRLLQYVYVAENANPIGEKNKLLTSTLQLNYDKAHAKYHMSFYDLVNEFKFSDLLLLDSRGNVVYSVNKNLDFATNLLRDPITSQSLQPIFNQAMQSKDVEATVINQTGSYALNGGELTTFFAYPVKDAGENIGVLVLLQKGYNAFVSNDQKEEIAGLGALKNFVINYSFFLTLFILFIAIYFYVLFSKDYAKKTANVKKILTAISEISQSMLKSSEAVERCKQKALAGRETFGHVFETMNQIKEGYDAMSKELDSKNKKMLEALNLIAELKNKTQSFYDLIFQTKLLSFNTAVEAKRVGAVGKSLSAMAGGMESLAQQSKKSANELSKQVTEIVGQVEHVIMDSMNSESSLIAQNKIQIDQGRIVAQFYDDVLDHVMEVVSEVGVANKVQKETFINLANNKNSERDKMM